MSNLTSVSIPVPLLQRARALGVNVSGTSRNAVLAVVEKLEKERGIAAKQNTTPQSNPDDISRKELHNEIGVSK